LNAPSVKAESNEERGMTKTEMTKRLQLRRESLRELTVDDLRDVAAATSKVGSGGCGGRYATI
jgi:hypothetical protein